MAQTIKDVKSNVYRMMQANNTTRLVVKWKVESLVAFYEVCNFKIKVEFSFCGKYA